MDPSAAISGLAVPAAFAERLAARPADPRLPGAPDGAAWLARVPRLLAERLADWSLTPDEGAVPWVGRNALVFPVRPPTLRPAALKLSWPHAEAVHEHLALRAWDGDGAVRLHAARPREHALLLERLDADRPLSAEPIVDACEEVGRLLRRLDRPAPPQLESLADRRERWDAALTRPGQAVPRRLLVQARSHLADLLADAPPPRLVHEDLHDGNVLAPLPGERGAGAPDWLAIDPKPVAGEAAYAVAPLVWNRPEVTARASRPRVHARMRADVAADVAGLDPERVRAWTFVRLVLNAVDAAEEGAAAAAFRTHMIGLAGAFAS